MDAPITLITATPGGGKTALAVKLMQEQIKAGRPLFVHGIPDLKLEHQPCPPLEQWTKTVHDEETGTSLPYFDFPQNALIVIDEAQRIFRPRAQASKVPPHVAAFETVRHTGVTFLLITQHPSLLDSNIRRLVGKHIHLRDLGVLGRRYYEWPEVGTPEQFKSAPIAKKYRLPREVFPLYKSASTHIKRNYSIPPVVVLLVVALLAVGGAGVMAYRSISAKMGGQDVAVVPLPDAPVRPIAPPKAGPVTVAELTPDDVMAAQVPRLSHQPNTAPMYDTLRVPVQMPTIVGCFSSSTRCKCYTQQGTDAGLDDHQCRQWLSNPPFDAYREKAPPLLQTKGGAGEAGGAQPPGAEQSEGRGAAPIDPPPDRGRRA